MKKWPVMLESLMTLYPFAAGAAIVMEWSHGRFRTFWFLVVLNVGNWAVTTTRNCQRARMMEEIGAASNLLQRAGAVNYRLLVDNVRVHAILAGLTGINMKVKVSVKEM